MKRNWLAVIGLVVGVGALILTAQPVAAESPVRESYLNANNQALSNNAINKEYHDKSSLTNSINGMLDLIYLGDAEVIADANGDKKVVYSGGLIPNMTNYIAFMYDHPAATTETFVADVLDSAGIATPAQAQGLGFASLNPILNTWKTFRNVAYLFFVVIFLVIGFMIMLRSKIGGQTVVTAQQAIPRIILSLVIVTFSYAIAGLLIDIMYLLMYLMLALFSKSSEQFLDHNFLTLGVKLIISGGKTAYEAVTTFFDSIENHVFFEEVGEVLGGITLALIVGIALAINIFRLFFELLKTYISIIISIAFSPILLMMNAIPGKNMLGTWIKSLVGNLAAFPTVLLALIIFDELTGGFSGSGSSPASAGGFMPPYLLNAGGGFSGSVSFMVGLGIILILPELVEQAKKSLGAEKGIFEQFAGQAGEALKRGMKGGELIPGVGIKLPYGGLSGENILRKAGIYGGAAGVGALKGAAAGAIGVTGWGMRKLTKGKLGWGGQDVLESMRTGFERTGGRIAQVTQDKQAFPQEVDHLKKNKKKKQES